VANLFNILVYFAAVNSINLFTATFAAFRTLSSSIHYPPSVLLRFKSTILSKKMTTRVFENPVIKDKVTVLKNTAETAGEYILVEVEMRPGGGNSLHYHTSFTETFIAVEGVLGIGIENKELHLWPGQHLTAGIKQLHRFFNPGNTTIRFRVKIAPARDSFLQSLSIGYGLAADGLTNDKGIPKKLDHLAFLLDLSDTRFKGFLALMTPFLLQRAKRVKRKGMGEELIKKYC
jgi:mannose-6-phosphate isomerase-like protein (cupin superfamily)